jgi:outer membrane lipoprotein-sorting protein
MKIVSIITFAIFSSFFITNLQAQTPEERGLEIAIAADKSDQGFECSQVKLKMILKNKHGQTSERFMETKALELTEDGDKSLIVFKSQKDVQGTATMTFTHKEGPDDQWLFLPAINRVKRISSSNKSGPFMGSEFAYEDLSSQEIEKYTYKYIKDESFDGKDCFVVERYPVDLKSGYTKQVVWLEKSTYNILKTDYYDRKAALLKTLTFEGYNQYEGKHWRANKMKMVNHLTSKETMLEFEDYKFKIGLTDEDFSQNSLKRAGG